MYLCQLIHQEIQKISGFKLDPERLDPQEYDVLLKNLNSSVKKLKFFKNILGCNSDTIVKFENWLIQKNINIFDPVLFDIVATSPEEITERSIIYVGDLDYKKYEKIGGSVSKLPEKLKVILGNLYAENTNIELVNLDYISGFIEVEWCEKLKKVMVTKCDENITLYVCSNLIEADIKDALGISIISCNNILKINLTKVEGISISKCSKLSSIKIGNSDDVTINENWELQELTIGNIKDLLKLSLNRSFSINNIYSAVPGQRIKIGNRLVIDDMFISNSLNFQEEILKKFDVNPANIKIDN